MIACDGAGAECPLLAQSKHWLNDRYWPKADIAIIAVMAGLRRSDLGR
jgi:hypothetical protein